MVPPSRRPATGHSRLPDMLPRVPPSGLSGDIQVHGVQVNLQTEQVQVDGAEHEVQGPAGTGASR